MVVAVSVSAPASLNSSKEASRCLFFHQEKNHHIHVAPIAQEMHKPTQIMFKTYHFELKLLKNQETNLPE
jgi:hypothetical protein